jgi:acetyl esterase
VRRAVAILAAVAAAGLAMAAPAAGSPARELYGGGVKVDRSAPQVLVLADQRYAVDRAPAHTFDAYLPLDGGGPHPGIVLIHGGGWRHGNKRDLAAEARYFAEHGFAAFSINYELAPKHRWPQQLVDSRAAVMWIRAHASTYAVDARRIGAFGTSAGAHLASMLAVMTDGMPDLGAGIMAAVAWSSPMDLVLLGELAGSYTRAEQFLGCSGETDCASLARSASPITYVSRGDADLFFVHSRNEFIPVQTAREMNTRMSKVRAPHVYIELPGTGHAAQYEDEAVPGASTTVLDASISFFASHL